jgi:Domain of unknown function (DUF4062)
VSDRHRESGEDRIVPEGSSEAHLGGRASAAWSLPTPVAIPAVFVDMPARRPRDVPGGRCGPLGRPPRRVFLSHTSERAASRGEQAFVVAARSAVIRAGDAMIDMAFFTAQGTDPADYCARMVTAADVYVGIIGLRYGSEVRGRQELSYTELEFETATAEGLPRLVFLLAEDSSGPGRPSRSGTSGRQAAFRRRLQRTGLTTAHVTSPAQLETRLYQALVELSIDDAGAPARVDATVIPPRRPRSPVRRLPSAGGDTRSRRRVRW